MAVVLPRGWEQVVAVLAVLRAGAAYVPVEPDWPTARIQHVLRRCGCELAVTCHPLAAGIAWPSGVTPIVAAAELTFPAEPAPRGTPDDTAYVIFTSGSTGEPKGVEISHRSAVNTILDINSRFAVEPSDRVLALSSLTFDLSVYDLFGTLAAGAAVVCLTPEESHDPARWIAWAKSAGVTVWNSVPAWIPVSLPDRFRVIVPDARIISLGGATEASIWSIFYPIDHVEPEWDSIPYGRPLDNQRFHVLDGNLQPVPAGVPGELCIGGAGLAREYWRDPARTAASFSTHLLTGERIYRTGDVGRYDRAGVIQFMGRRDSQVKIRGFRVEPGEVEANLVAHPAVTAAAVVVRGDALHRRLYAYVVSSDASPSTAQLRDYLAERVPGYLVPAGFMFLDDLPLTANGKVDRGALPDPASARPATSAPFAPATTDLEALLVEVWCKVLGLDTVGVDDDFFELGGDSLTTMRLAAHLHRRGLHTTIGAVFENPTVRALASVINPTTVEPGLPAVPRLDHVEPVPLTHPQEMIQILNLLTPGNTAYVPRACVEFRGPLDVAALRRALNALEARHAALRTSFAAGHGGQLQQHVRPPAGIHLHQHDLTALSEADTQAELGRILGDEVAAVYDSTGAEPLHRFALAQLAEDHHLLMFSMDHLICDGWSLMILQRDLFALYQAEQTHRSPQLPVLPVEYVDYAVWQRKHMAGERLERTVEFWRARMAGAPPMQLPSSKPPASTNEMRGRVLNVRVEPDVVRGVSDLARRERTTVFAVLLAAVQATVWAQVHEDVITVSAPVGGRLRPELEDIVGCFVHGMLFPTDMTGDPTLAELVRRVRDGIRAAWEHQNLPLMEMAGIREFAMVNNMGTQGIALEWVDDQTGATKLPGDGGTVIARPWWPRRNGEVDMPPADLFIYLHRSPDDEGLEGEFMYNSARFDVHEITAVFEQLRHTLRLCGADPDRRLSQLLAPATS